MSAAKDRIIVNLRLRDYLGAPIGMASLGGYGPDQMVELEAGTNRLAVTVACPTLANGAYFLDLDLERPFSQMVEQITDSLSFEVKRIPDAYGRVLLSGWGVGSIELSMQLAATAEPTAGIAAPVLPAPAA